MSFALLVGNRTIGVAGTNHVSGIGIDNAVIPSVHAANSSVVVYNSIVGNSEVQIGGAVAARTCTLQVEDLEPTRMLGICALHAGTSEFTALEGCGVDVAVQTGKVAIHVESVVSHDALVDAKHQVDGVIATVNIRSDFVHRVVSDRVIIGDASTIPHERIASHNSGVVSMAVVDGEFQGIDVRADTGLSQRVAHSVDGALLVDRVITTCDVEDINLLPLECVAHCHSVGIVLSGADIEGDGGNAVAHQVVLAGHLGGIVVGTADSVGLTVPNSAVAVVGNIRCHSGTVIVAAIDDHEVHLLGGNLASVDGVNHVIVANREGNHSTGASGVGAVFVATVHSVKGFVVVTEVDSVVHNAVAVVTSAIVSSVVHSGVVVGNDDAIVIPLDHVVAGGINDAIPAHRHTVLLVLNRSLLEAQGEDVDFSDVACSSVDGIQRELAQIDQAVATTLSVVDEGIQAVGLRNPGIGLTIDPSEVAAQSSIIGDELAVVEQESELVDAVAAVLGGEVTTHDCI